MYAVGTDGSHGNTAHILETCGHGNKSIQLMLFFCEHHKGKDSWTHLNVQLGEAHLWEF